MDSLFLLSLNFAYQLEIMRAFYACDIILRVVCCWNHYLCEQLKIYRRKVSCPQKLELQWRITTNGSPNWQWFHLLLIVSFESRKESRHKSQLPVSFYCSGIRSLLKFSCQLFQGSLPKYLYDDIEHIQRRAMRVIFPSLSYCEAIDKAGIPTLSERRVNCYLLNYLKIL